MRIIFIGQKGIPATYGGVEKHVEDLATRLVRDGHEVTVYTRKKYTSDKLKSYKGVELISLPSIATKHLDAISHTFLACLDVIFRQKADVVHFHSIGPSLLTWMIKVFKPRTRLVATFHSQCYNHQKWGSLAKFFLHMGEWMICTVPDKTITVSRSLTSYAAEKYGKTTTYIPNGVEVMAQKEADLIKKWGLESGNYIVTISRLVRHKGIQYLIDAYKQIDTKKKLVIVGDGAFTDDYVHELKDLAGNNPNIIFTGNQSGEILQELFSNAFLFVQPSESEGLSIALLEAMSYGRPVLVSDILENVEIVNSVGFVFANKKVDDLTLKLRAVLLMDEAVLQENALKLKSIVANNYNWGNIVREIEVLYKK
ncbi:glycosyltransferase family 4 protein [Candidatus Parcubacteria bacterium]|nr:glycosyltransferase family 4 protein [Patescibacteria group bacterium]MBU4308973.1 glycosyltransferase family 4 protein [Patescibacteria group bacterium]MBU4431857.1 glycosyltransferase family 4 protein [Patescibacteria group bacterium]MBU4577333.1 glycosyltransferase family 4 protein [Patescibacteria group bacterium]MCG2697021.1 glycosyltransferase family 4 protein [Candidatus Parcubacteria bacterium]